jgi:hypothetical protein
MFTFPSEILDKFFRDPVMAAYCIMGVELDDFQQARLRYYWFVPHKVDSSGWGTGKTIVEWVYAVLRAVLIPSNKIGIYYPIFQTGKDAWWQYFSKIRHDVLEAQYRPRKHEWKDAGCWRCEFKNGSEILLPAPGFLSNAMNQASRSFNTMIIGEYTQASMRGEGVDELIGRVREPNFNKKHPIWANHTLLSAHAESPTHPSYRYYKAVRDALLGKFTQEEQHTNATFTAAFTDWSEKKTKDGQSFKTKFRDDAAINKTKRSSPKDEVRRRLHGIWSQDGKGWYPAELIKNVLRSEIKPIAARELASDLYVLGEDTAPGMTGKADWCAFKVWRIREVADPKKEQWTDEVEGRYFHVSLVFGHMLRNVDAVQISGFIHYLHLVFGFSKIVLDPSGGGSWIYKEMIKPRQLIFNAWKEVTGLCTRDEPTALEKQPIVVFFKRGSELDELWQPRFLQSDEGIVEAAHRTLREGFEATKFLWPQLREYRPHADFEAMSDQEKWAQIYLDIAYKQAIAIRVKVTPEGKPLLTKRGFYSFEAQGAKKKDAIYAALYGYVGVRLVMKNAADTADQPADEVIAG